ncbi:MAG: hypothetical protein JMN27_18260 [gamma proteobacterium endosymbiont of Lamellibrachia anaximandri]|nr:hypothetical protein [gamma proteobacterium endosymbiont of Lamellibrachia anaximandri]MBL3535749.1 hypothetical protein [gamma proteobacterium endosymbiont of Lamellibrachia anaximandri]
MKSVLHAPVAMAIRACSMQAEQLVKLSNTDLYQLQQVRQFDEQWYREAFSLTVVYLFSADLLNTETNKENKE